MSSVEDNSPVGELLCVDEHERSLRQQASAILSLVHQITAPERVVDPILTADVVASLGKAAFYLQQSAQQMSNLPVGVTLSTEVQPAQVVAEVSDRPVEPLGVEPSAPTEPTASEVQTDEETAEVAAEQGSEEAAEAAWLRLDMDKVRASNARAVETYGSDTRNFVIHNDGHFSLDGVDKDPIYSTRNKRSQEYRQTVLGIFLNSGGEDVTASQMKDAGIDGTSVANVTRYLHEELQDADGSSIIVIEKLSAKRFRYRLADDVVIVDRRPTARATELAAAAGEEAESDDQEPREVLITEDSITIGDVEYSIYSDEARTLRAVHVPSAPITAVEAAQNYFGRAASEEEVETVGDELFYLYKQCMVAFHYVEDEEPRYAINLQAPEVEATKHIIEVGDETVYLSDLDVQILRTIYQATEPKRTVQIAHILYGDVYVSAENFDMVARTIRKYFLTTKLVTRDEDSNWSITQNVRNCPELLQLIES